MSGEAKRWLGNTVIALLVVAVGFGAWALLVEGDDADPSPRPSLTAAPMPTPSPTPTDSGSGTATAPPTEAPTYINAAPSETPPIRPPDEMTDAGFEAFVRYFVQVSDWALATMDPTLLDEVSSPECGGCTAIIRAIREERAAGNRIEGNRYTLLRLSVNPDLSPDGTFRNAGYWWDATALTIYGPDGAVIRQDPPTTNAEWSLNSRFSNGRWAAVGLLYVEHVP